MDFFMHFPNTYYIKHKVNKKEHFMQQYVYQLNIVNVPKIIYYDEESEIMIMKKVGDMSLSDYYGDNADDIPNESFDQVVKIVRNLVLHNIEYPDLTGYNFVEDNDGKVWIIDFGHSQMMTTKHIDNIHIQNICNGYKKWNPEFK
jgi:tRNA A-37 threonylcarbamoyl transferase component Bud32